MLCDIFQRNAISIHQLIERGQGRGQLRTGDDLRIPSRNKGMCATRIRTVIKAHTLHQSQGVAIHLPTCRRMRMRCLAKYLGKTIHRTLQLSPSPLSILVGNIILPADVIKAMNTDFKTRIANAAQNIGALTAYIGPGQQSTVQQGFNALVFHDRGT